LFDYLVVGAGFAGSVIAERLASDWGKKILIIDRRPHIGGNAFDYYDEHGILVHKYGPHIFHTNSADIFDYLSRFTEWRPYQHRVLASVDGLMVPLPVNLDTINLLYGMRMTAFEVEEFLARVREERAPVRTSEDVVVGRIGRELYEKLFRSYTKKQWGLDPSELDASVTARLPVRTNRDARYFTDRYQAMPERGYAHLFTQMLSHRNIKILLQATFADVSAAFPAAKVIYTGPINEYFGNRLGVLPYRSLEFIHQTLDCEYYQPVAQINYPNDYAYTRVTEFKHLTGQKHSKTSIVYEYPTPTGEPFYPIATHENAKLLDQYERLADTEPNVHFIGRLGTYRYYNMDQVVGQALAHYARLRKAADR
jgi:UDP-galactopyranose mutase